MKKVYVNANCPTGGVVKNFFAKKNFIPYKKFLTKYRV